MTTHVISNNTPTQPDPINFKVNIQTGEAFISVRKTAELIDVPDTTLRHYLDSPNGAPNFDRKQGLTPEILHKVTHEYSLKGNQKAIELLAKLGKTVLQLGMKQLFPTLATQ